MSILVIGTVAFDSIEAPSGTVDHILGGSATYITLSASSFGVQTRLVAVVGGDFPEKYVNVLRDANVDLAGLETIQDKETFHWAGRYEANMDTRVTLATDLNVLLDFDPKVPEAFRSSRIVCLGNLDPTIQRKVVEQMEGDPFIICDSMNFWIDNTYDSLLETLKLVDVLVINDEEAIQLGEDSNLVTAASNIRERGPEYLIIKKGTHGALVFGPDLFFAVPAYPLADVVDPTGAGDVFMGGLAGYLSTLENLKGDDLKKGIVYGSALASYVVQGFGPEPLIGIDFDDVESRVEDLRSFTTIPE